MSTPNVARGIADGDKWIGFNKSYEHLHYFESGTLGKAMEKAGLRPVRVFTSEHGAQHPLLLALNPMATKDGYNRIAANPLYRILRPILRPAYRKINELSTKRYVRRGLGHTLHMIAKKEA